MKRVNPIALLLVALFIAAFPLGGGWWNDLGLLIHHPVADENMPSTVLDQIMVAVLAVSTVVLLARSRVRKS